MEAIGSIESASRPQELCMADGHCAVSVESGSVGYQNSDRPAVLTASDTLICGSRRPLVLRPEVGSTLKWVTWNGPEARSLERIGYVPERSRVVRDPTGIVPRAYFSLRDLETAEDAAVVLERKKIILNMIVELFKTAEMAHHKRSPNHHEMSTAIKYIRAHYREAIDTSQIASLVNYSPTHFRRLFKERTGMSPRQYITTVRIRKAIWLLIHGMSIKECAYDVGYTDVCYFMKVFHKVTGYPPGEFQHRILGFVQDEPGAADDLAREQLRVLVPIAC